MIANPAIEQMDREDMAELQLKKLKKQFQWAMEKSAFYYRKFTDAGVAPDAIQSLADIEKLPFTTIDELQETTVYNLLTLPMSGVLRISKLGYNESFIKMYTNGDLAYQIEMMTRVMVAQGIHGAVVAGLLGEASDSRLMDIQYALCHSPLGDAVPKGTGKHGRKQGENINPHQASSGRSTTILPSGRLISFTTAFRAGIKICWAWPFLEAT